MASREWFSDKISDLTQENQRISLLSEFRDQFQSLPLDEAQTVANNVQLPLVFDCLNDSNKEQVDLACEVLSLLLGNLQLGKSTDQYEPALERALTHPNPSVKLMILNEIERSLISEETLCQICEKTSLLRGIMMCIGDEDLAVANKASSLIINIGITVPGSKKLISNELLIPLQDLISLNEVIKLRVYEVIINISKKAPFCLENFTKVGLVPKILAELDNDDILLKMNIIEILCHLAEKEHGFFYLDQNGVLDKIFALTNDDDITSQLCKPGVIKFFGRVGIKKPRELVAKYPALLDYLYSNIESSDLTIVGVSLDAIGHIGSTPFGKIALSSTGAKIDGTIKTVFKLLSSLPTETRIRALNCLQNLFHSERCDTVQLSERWYGLLGPDATDVIVRYAKNPFSELKLAGLGILKSLSEQHWGQEVIKNTPGLIEFLLDRNVETDKDCKEAKFDIVRNLSRSHEVFDIHTLEKFQQYVKEGPFYVQAVTEVAIEGN
ncbi:26S proteasome non-ATPase regulatory subunit 5 [Anthonomus grandis grandis]|uniref:26S proteasome non-ATPase regulatory subunit 5 n=1 Tax=Anthonomus grandis grandis TaxID=2921223 RepID=UPI0021654A11|nr:26S proteasome non-ATPase regulatory subunit 5 [Anthonomus grandis grandis]